MINRPIRILNYHQLPSGWSPHCWYKVASLSSITANVTTPPRLWWSVTLLSTRFITDTNLPAADLHSGTSHSTGRILHEMLGTALNPHRLSAFLSTNYHSSLLTASRAPKYSFSGGYTIRDQATTPSSASAVTFGTQMPSPPQPV